MKIPIPFNKPTRTGDELAFIRRALESSCAGDGEYTKKCQIELERVIGRNAKVLLTTSCTDALEMSAILLNVDHEDEVIAPAFTFPSSIGAFVRHGATPVFADIDPITLGIDVNSVMQKITDATSCIVGVHYAGINYNMNLHQLGVPVVEDAAHALYGHYNGQRFGTFGMFGTFSFHDTKNFTCGEGGALVINDENYIERAEQIRVCGTNRAQYAKGLVSKYNWVEPQASSFLPSELNAAMLWAQLCHAEKIQHDRHQLWTNYYENLKGWAQGLGIQLPCVPDGCAHAAHMFYLVMPSNYARESLLNYLSSRKIQATTHYMPLNLAPAVLKGQKCPVAEDVAMRILRLPFYTDMYPDDQKDVIAALYDYA